MASIAFEEYKNKLNNLRPALDDLGGALHLDEARNEVEKLEEESAQDGLRHAGQVHFTGHAAEINHSQPEQRVRLINAHDLSGNSQTHIIILSIGARLPQPAPGKFPRHCTAPAAAGTTGTF